MNYCRPANELSAVLMELKLPEMVLIDGSKAGKCQDSVFCFSLCVTNIGLKLGDAP